MDSYWDTHKFLITIHRFNGDKRVKILRNAAMCRKCNDIIVSTYRHDFVSCKCGSIFIDGGFDYLRSDGNEKYFKDLSEWEDTNEGNDTNRD